MSFVNDTVAEVTTVETVTTVAEVAPATGTPVFGKVAVPTAGTAVAFPTATLKSGVTIRARTGNTGLVYIGGAAVDAATGHELAQGDSVFIEITALQNVYVDAATSADEVTYLGT